MNEETEITLDLAVAIMGWRQDISDPFDMRPTPDIAVQVRKNDRVVYSVAFDCTKIYNEEFSDRSAERMYDFTVRRFDPFNSISDSEMLLAAAFERGYKVVATREKNHAYVSTMFDGFFVAGLVSKSYTDALCRVLHKSIQIVRDRETWR